MSRPYRMKPFISEEPAEPPDNPIYLPDFRFHLDPLIGEENSWNDSPRFSPFSSVLRKQPKSLRYYAESADARSRVSTGLPHLDAILGGGLRTADLHVICGAPSSFKTSVATQIAIHLSLQGHPSTLLLADDSPFSLGRQLLSLAGPEDAKHPVILDSEATVEEAINELRQRSEYSLLTPVLVVDSAQRALPDRRSFKDERERVNRTLDLLRLERAKAPLIILLVSKANRESYSSRSPDVSPLAVGAESSYLESDADVQLTLTSIPTEHARLRVAKHRGWPPGQTVLLELDRTAQRLTALSPEEERAREFHWSEEKDRRKRSKKAESAEKKAKEAKERSKRDKETIRSILQVGAELSKSALEGQAKLSRARVERAVRSLEEEGAAKHRRKAGAHLYHLISSDTSAN